MREIKFRVMRDSDSQWIYFTLGDLHTGVSQGITVVSKTWCQYTGLKDRNGMEIYEGDICRHSSYCREIAIVTFNNKNYPGIPAFHLCDSDGKSIDYYYGVPADCECEVIGNIYENPELLEQSK